MPWKQTDAMTERVKLITEYLSGNYSVSELSRRFEVSRPIVYKWIERYEQGSLAAHVYWTAEDSGPYLARLIPRRFQVLHAS